jgi:hypothetical protein
MQKLPGNGEAVFDYMQQVLLEGPTFHVSGNIKLHYFSFDFID